jgi:hypothetical protein
VSVAAERASVQRTNDVFNFHFVHAQSLRTELSLTSACLDQPGCAASELSCGPAGCYPPTPSPAGAVVRSDLGPFTVTQ